MPRNRRAVSISWPPAPTDRGVAWPVTEAVERTRETTALAERTQQITITVLADRTQEIGAAGYRPAGSASAAGRSAAWFRRVRRVPAGLTAVTSLALGLRLWRLDATGFNSDEAVYGGQAASLAGNPNYTDLFPVFRAHPMLVQTVLSPLFGHGEVDVAGRVVIAVLGVATVLAATLTLYCLVRFVEAQAVLWLVAAAGMLGLTMLTKESSIVLAGGVYAFLALTPTIRRPIRSCLIAAPALVIVFAIHPLSQALAGRANTGKSYLVWQLLRRPNHSMAFYAQTVPVAIGLLVLLAAGAGLWSLRRRHSWRETLLLCWLGVPVVAFQLWPVKGFQYLLPVATPAAILAARGLLVVPLQQLIRDPRRALAVRVAVIGTVVLSLLVPVWSSINRRDTTTFLAGSGGVPGGRETGRWLASHTPSGSAVLTLGPSMANILQYYGHRRCYGLSVSPNPLHRNPAYAPLANPDRSLRHNELQYIVWDAFSAKRSVFFSERLLALARRYHGRVVHTEYVRGVDAEGRSTNVPVIVVYEVRP